MCCRQSLIGWYFVTIQDLHESDFLQEQDWNHETKDLHLHGKIYKIQWKKIRKDSTSSTCCKRFNSAGVLSCNLMTDCPSYRSFVEITKENNNTRQIRLFKAIPFLCRVLLPKNSTPVDSIWQISVLKKNHKFELRQFVAKSWRKAQKSVSSI